MDDALRWLVDRARVTDRVLRFARAMDEHDWGALRQCLDDLLDVDYSAFRGEPRTLMSADEFVERRRITVGGLHMQHLSTNHLVELAEDAAVCRSCYVIHRVAPGLPEGENALDSAGHYLHRLRRDGDDWRITGIVQTLVWMRGNPAVHGALAHPDRLPSGVRSLR